ncbi:MAG TPA: Ig-like domain-containing protein [Bacteriovoracaceae bacterium]|nr:Ig-like domain-containing protein [Bacteriovoracaceae bacterium]
MADVGLANVASSDVLGPVVAPLEISRSHGDYMGEVVEVGSSYSYLAVFVKNPDGVKRDTSYKIVLATGVVKNIYLDSLKDANGLEVASIPLQGVAYIPWVYGVPVNSHLFQTYSLIDLTVTSAHSAVTYNISHPPKYGFLLGTPPSVIYVPNPGFVGYDRFYYTATDVSGNYSRASVTINVTPDIKMIYLKTTGNDATGTVDNINYPFQTAQAAVDAAMEINTSASNTVVIRAYAGSFGAVTLDAAFGDYVSWIGAGVTSSYIGNITATGDDGAIDFAGKPGPAITIKSDNTITFADITSRGGNGGAAATKDTQGGKAGIISFKGTGGNIYAISGMGASFSDGSCIGAHGGQVTIQADTTVSSVTSNGYSCATSGNGGTIEVAGEVTGDIYAEGGAGTVSGMGGTVKITGTVNGSIFVPGGDGDAGGAGGTVNIFGHVLGSIDASGGDALVENGGAGGAIHFFADSSGVDIYAPGGFGLKSGGQGGYVYLLRAAAQDVFVNGGASLSTVAAVPVNAGGKGGGISLDGYSSLRNISAKGGDCNTTEAGDGGDVLIHSTSTYSLNANVVNGGACGMPGSVGTINPI